MPDLVESLKCPQCGGPLKLGPGDVIVTCPYCGTASRIRSEIPFLLRHAMLAARLAREEVASHERELLKDSVDIVEDARSEISLKDTELLHAPVWLSTFEYRGRPYRIIIDGASGEIVRGDIPPPTGGLGEFLKDAGRGVFGR